MHIHTTQANAAGHALAGAQAAETSLAMRRARELREKADKIKALATGGDSELASSFAADPQTIAMIGSWSASQAHSAQPNPAQPNPVQTAASDSSSDSPHKQEVKPTPASGPVSFWA
jgi:hypothetical protein